MRSSATVHRLHGIAVRAGWQVDAIPGLMEARRGPIHLRIEFNHAGVVHYALRVGGGRSRCVKSRERHKADRVARWLTEGPKPAERRSTSNGNARGGSEQRRRRRQWLVDEFGDGEHVACHMQLSLRCERVLTVDTVSADRIVPGGSYRRSNIQPGCGPCQREQGGRLGVERKASRQGGLTPTSSRG